MARGPNWNDERSGAGLSDAAPHYHGHRERLRARFREAGSDAVTDYELLELLLFRALPRRDVKPLAKTLIAKFGSFAETIAAPPQRLAEVPGLGDAAITEIKIVQAAANRLARGEVKRRPILSSWSTVLDYCRTAMAFADKEHSASYSSTSATSSSPTNCSRSAPSTIRRSIRARSSSAPSN
jgi:DNA repair protein RadC